MARQRLTLVNGALQTAWQILYCTQSSKNTSNEISWWSALWSILTSDNQQGFPERLQQQIIWMNPLIRMGLKTWHAPDPQLIGWDRIQLARTELEQQDYQWRRRTPGRLSLPPPPRFYDTSVTLVSPVETARVNKAQSSLYDQTQMWFTTTTVDGNTSPWRRSVSRRRRLDVLVVPLFYVCKLNPERKFIYIPNPLEKVLYIL